MALIRVREVVDDGINFESLIATHGASYILYHVYVLQFRRRLAKVKKKKAMPFTLPRDARTVVPQTYSNMASKGDK